MLTVLHRITHLGGGGGFTSSTLVYILMQARSKAKENEKQLKHLQELYYSNFIGLKQYLVSVSFMVGKVTGKYKNPNSVDQEDVYGLFHGKSTTKTQGILKILFF